MNAEISVVVEWENAILAEDSREDRMLGNLVRQIGDLDKAVEVVVLFNPDLIDESALRRKLDQTLGVGTEKHGCVLKVVGTRGRHYFDLKNEGGRLANGQLVVFIDSDVVPEEGWLNEMVRPFFADADVNVIAGSSYIEPNDLYSKAFALGWFFPLRNNEVLVHDQRQKLWGNNVAFRKDVFMRFPFPEMPQGATRGAGILLAEQLRNARITIWTSTGARVAHPAPNGFAHFYKRAMAQGRDYCLRNRGGAISGLGKLFFDYYFKKVKKVVKRTARQHKAVDLPTWQTPLAVLIMLGYYTFGLVGGVITLSMPRYAKSSWRI